MKYLIILFCLVIYISDIHAQQNDQQILLKLYERCATITQGRYTITERKKNFTSDDTVLTKKKVYFINAANSNLTPPYCAKIIDLNSKKVVYVDSGGVEIIYNAADSSKITRSVNKFNHIFGYFMPFVNRTNIISLKEFPEGMAKKHIEENNTSYILHIDIDQQDETMGVTKGKAMVFFDKKTLLPFKEITVANWNGMNEYSEILITDCDFSPLTESLAFPANLPVNPPKPKSKSVSESQIFKDSTFALKPGQIFPPMKLMLHNGSAYDLSKDSAKLYILDFWYISCAPCILLSNTLKTFQHQYANAPVRILGIDPKDSTAAIQNWIQKRGINYPSCVQAAQFASFIGIGNAFPVVVVLDENKKVLKAIIGYNEEVEAELDKLIKETLH